MEEKVIILSVRPEHLAKIFFGVDPIEFEIPPLKRELPIDVYLYCTKSKPYLVLKETVAPYELFSKAPLTNVITKEHAFIYTQVLNGTIVAKFTLMALEKNKITENEITNLERVKMELHHFYVYKEKTIHCGMDCPPYVDEEKCTLQKAPRTYMYAYVEK